MSVLRVRSAKIATPPYAYHIYIRVSDSITGAAWMKRAGCAVDLSSCEGLTFAPNHECCIYIWLENYGVTILAHEVTHAVFAVLHGSGIPISRGNEEVIAYLYGQVMHDATEKLAKMKEARSLSDAVQAGKLAAKASIQDLPLSHAAREALERGLRFT